MRVQEPFNGPTMFHPDDSIIDVSGVKVGGKKLVVIAGPCSVEGQQQMDTIAASVKQSGAAMLQGGASLNPYLLLPGLRTRGWT